MLEQHLLRLFVALHETRSVSGAARELGFAQPTVSAWLAELRRELNDPLFVRTGGGMVPTPRADELIELAREAVASLRRLTDEPRPFDPATDARSFRICMTDASHVTLLPRILAHLRAAAPFVRLEAQQIDERTPGRLQSGEVALALGLIPSLEKGFFQQALYAQDWVCLVSAGHPRVSVALSRADYAREPHVEIAQGTGRPLLHAAWQREGIEPKVLVRIPGFLGLPAIIGGTDLVATLPRNIGETLAEATGLALHPCPIPVRGFSVKQHWHARFHRDPANRWLRANCALLFQNKPPGRAP